MHVARNNYLFVKVALGSKTVGQALCVKCDGNEVQFLRSSKSGKYLLLTSKMYIVSRTFLRIFLNSLVLYNFFYSDFFFLNFETHRTSPPSSPNISFVILRRLQKVNVIALRQNNLDWPCLKAMHTNTIALISITLVFSCRARNLHRGHTRVASYWSHFPCNRFDTNDCRRSSKHF